jgi:hypothetical protein
VDRGLARQSAADHGENFSVDEFMALGLGVIPSQKIRKRHFLKRMAHGGSF